MKVVLSYACELEDIPKTVAELLNNLNNQFEDSVSLLGEAEINSRNDQVLVAINTIDSLRKLLAKIDLSLMDYSTVLSGYAKTSAELKMPQKNSEEMEVTSNDESKETND